MKKTTFMVLPIKFEGKDLLVQVEDKYFKQLYSEAKSKNEDHLTFQFQFEDKNLQISVLLSEAEKLIRKTEMNTPFIPKNLAKYMSDYTRKLIHKPIAPIVGRDNEIEKVWFYISQKTRNNVSLIGDIEVGKTAIAKEIARQILDSDCPKEFYGRRVLTLKLHDLMDISKDFILKRKIDQIMEFLAKNRNKIVLFIDSAIVMKTDEYLIEMLYKIIKTNIPLIMTLSTEYYERYFLEDSNITKYMNEVYVEEPEINEVQPMVMPHIMRLQQLYGITISEEMIKFGIYTSVLSNSASCNPGCAINVFDKAFLEAKRKGIDHVGKHSILSCYDSYIKLYNKMTEQEKRATAYHETGHYIVRVMSQYNKDLKVSFVSILPMMTFLGVNYFYADYYGNNTIPSRDYYIDDIAVDLAGRIAEKEIVGTFTSGADSDLDHANKMSKLITMRFALDDDISSSNFNRVYDYEDYYLLPENEKKKLETKRQAVIKEGYDRARKILEDNKGLLYTIAEKLMEEEILTGEQLEEIVKEYLKCREELITDEVDNSEYDDVDAYVSED